MNIKLKNAMLYVLLSIFMSFPMFAMEMKENEIKDGHITSALMERLEFYRNQVTNLKEEKLKLVSDTEDLKREFFELNTQLQKADLCIEYLLNEATPTTLNYLSAYYNDSDNDELEKLKDQASNTMHFENLITRLDGRQIRPQTPVSTSRLLNIHGDKIKVQNPSPTTIGYADATISGTPREEIAEFEKTVGRSRRRNLFGENKTEPDVSSTGSSTSSTSSTEEIILQVENLKI